MAILDVQFRRGSLAIGRSTTFDADEHSVLSLLCSFAKSLHQENHDLVAPLIGTVRRPDRVRAGAITDGARVTVSDGRERRRGAFPVSVSLTGLRGLGNGNGKHGGFRSVQAGSRQGCGGLLHAG